MKAAIWAIFGVILADFAFLEIFYLGLTNDTDMLLHTTTHMLYEGGLYQRWLTVNSPFIYFIDALPVFCSVYYGIPPAMALHGFAAELCVLSLLISYKCLCHPSITQRERRIWLAAAAMALLVAPCAFHTYGDREHFLFIFAMPWILQMLLRLKPTRFSLYLAMIGFLIKPYNLILLPALVLAGGPREYSLRQRVFSPSAIAGAIVTALYLLFLTNVFPEYLSVILPIAYKTYAAVTFSFETRAIEAGAYFMLTLILIGFLRPAAIRFSIFGLMAAAAIIYCLNAGWTYTQYLLCAPVTLFCAALWLSKGFVRKSAAILLSLGIFSYSAYGLGLDVYVTAKTGNADNYNKISNEIKQALQQAAGDDFLLLSTSNLWSTTIAALKGPPHSVYAFFLNYLMVKKSSNEFKYKKEVYIK